MLNYTAITIGNGYNASQINTNFTRINTSINEGLSRSDNTDNAMEVDLDLGANNILNVDNITVATDVTVGGISILTQVTNAAASADDAAASASAAATSESNAATSETNAAASAATAATHVTTANNWATQVGSYVSGSDSSAKEWAIGTFEPLGSAKDWATEAEDVLVDGSGYSAFHWAQKAGAAANSNSVAVSGNDTLPGYLISKLTAANGLAWTEINDGGDEDFQIGIGAQIAIGSSTLNSTIHAHTANSNASTTRYTNLTTGTTSGDGFDVGINASEQAYLWNYENTAMIVGVNNTEVARFHASGSILLGTNANNGQNLRLHEASVGANYMQFTNTDTGELSSNGLLVGINASEEVLIYNQENTKMSFGTNNTTRLNIAANGGLFTQGATGGSQGVDTINASSFYDDGVELISLAAVANTKSYQQMYVYDDPSNTIFDIDAVIGTAFETIGPTGSGATNIWTALDGLPSNASVAKLSLFNELTGSTTSTSYQSDVHIRSNDGGAAKGDRNLKSRTRFINRSGLSESDSNVAEIDIPLDSNQIFQCATGSLGTAPTINTKFYLVGYGLGAFG